MAIRFDELNAEAPVADDKPGVMRLGDALSTQRVNLDAEERLFDVSPEQVTDWESQGPIGAMEAWRRQDKTEMIPFTGSVEMATKAVRVLRAVDRLKNQKHSDDDIELVTRFLEKSEEERIRGYTIPGRIVQGVAQLPGFMVEFLATGGAGAIGKKAVLEGAEAVGKQAVKKGVLGFTVKTTALAAGAATRTAAMPQRVAASAAQRQLEGMLQLTDKGIQILEQGQEKPSVSIMKGYGDVMIENFSEVTGPGIAKFTKAVIPAPIANGFVKLWRKLRPNQAIEKLFTKAGYNGFLEELGEERVGAFLRAVFDVEDFGAANPDQMMDRIIASIPNGEELLVEAGVLAVPGLVGMTASQAASVVARRKQEAEVTEPALREATDQEIKDIANTDPDVSRETSVQKRARFVSFISDKDLKIEGSQEDVEFVRDNLPEFERVYDEEVKREYRTSKANIVSADLPKMISVEGRTGFTAEQSGPRHAAGSAFAKLKYEQLLEDQSTLNQPVAILGGVSGAGKTTGAQGLAEFEQYAAVYDTNLTGLGSASQKVDQALKTGRKVQIIYVDRHPITAFKDGVFPRFKRTRRIVSIETHLNNAKSRQVIDQLQEKYADNSNVEIILVDNNGPKGQAKQVENLIKVDYTINGVRKALQEFIDAEARKGTITKSEQAAFKAGLKVGGKGVRKESERERQKELGESFSFGESVKSFVIGKPTSSSISKLQERLDQIEDLSERALTAKLAKEQLAPIVQFFSRGIRVPKKGEPLFEEFSKIPARFENQNGTAPDEIKETANNADLGFKFDSDAELAEFLEKLDRDLKEIDDTIERGKVALITQRETTQIKQRISDVKTGIREGRQIGKKEVASAKEILDKRRRLIRSVREDFGLTDADLRKITQKDIRLMNDAEFKNYLYGIEVMAADLHNRRVLKNAVLFQIQDKELRKVDNLRAFLKFPTLENMTTSQLNEFNQLLEETQWGDEFLSVRKLETVKNTDLGNIKTVREAKEILARKLGVKPEKLDNIPVSPLDKFLFDTALARRNDFYKFLVDETNKSIIDSEQRFFEMEREVDRLTNAARRSRKDRSFFDKLVPTDEIVFQWLEAPIEVDRPDQKTRTKEELAEEMTDEELALAGYLQSRFAQFRDYLIQHKTLERFRDNYITHIRRGFLEAFKEDGLVTALSEFFIKQKEDEAIFKILEDDTENILPLEKFFQFAVRRTGELKPSKNVARAFKAYTRAMLKKQALDKIVPALDIYAYTLSPKRLTQRGLQMDRRLIKFVRQWVNNKKGRRVSLDGLLPQNGAVDIALRSIDAFISLVDLGFNIPVNIAVSFGEQSFTFIQLGTKKYATGLNRMKTAKGKKILTSAEGFLGKDVFRDLQDSSDTVGDKFNKGLFAIFSLSNLTANKVFLLGSLTEQEWASGEIAPERLGELRREMGRYRHVQGSKSIFGSTALGGVLTKYKTWALPPLNTVTANIKAMIGMLRKGQLDDLMKSREFAEIFRATMFTTVVVLAGKGLVDDDDDSFLGAVLKKAYRDALSFIGVLNPNLFLTEPRLVGFLSDLGIALEQIIFLEQYKSKKGFKGVEKLKRTITPRAIRQFQNEEKKGVSVF